MCGRYQFDVDHSEEIRQIVQAVEQHCGSGNWQPGEIYPASKAPVIVNHNGVATPELMRWGYPISNHLVINARSESATTKPLFGESVRSRRCIVPATGFYEWDHEKRKYFFVLPNSGVLYMAGLYDQWIGEKSYCILTTKANNTVQPVHDRMPLILGKQDANAWLFSANVVTDIFALVPPNLLSEPVDRQISFF